MTWWMAENNVQDPEELKNFDAGWRFSEEDSSENEFVFLSTDRK